MVTMSVLAGLVNELIGQLEGEPPPPDMPPRPLEPIERIPWALEYGLRRRMTPDDWLAFDAAMPAVGDHPELLAGVVAGVGLAINDIVREHIDLAKMALKFTVEFYSVVYDLKLWDLIVSFWTNPNSTPDAVVTYVEEKHPALWTAINEFPKFDAKVTHFVEELTSTDPLSETSDWTKVESYITDLMCDALFGVGQMLKDDVTAIVAAKGDAIDQGKIIGRRVARAIIEAVMLAMDLFSLIRGVAKELGEVAMKLSRTLFGTPELVRVVAKVEKIAPGIESAARKVAKNARTEVEHAYQELAHRIAPYGILKDETGAFNKGVRHVYGYSTVDVEYVALRLDAHHIIEQRFLNTNLKNEFIQKLGWKSIDDMDTIALHTEWHIRSGERMSVNLGLRGAEGEPSLSKALIDGIAKKEPANGFANLRQLIDAYEDVYLEYAPALYVDKLQGWFDAIKLKVP